MNTTIGRSVFKSARPTASFGHERPCCELSVLSKGVIETRSAQPNRFVDSVLVFSLRRILRQGPTRLHPSSFHLLSRLLSRGAKRLYSVTALPVIIIRLGVLLRYLCTDTRRLFVPIITGSMAPREIVRRDGNRRYSVPDRFEFSLPESF